MANLYLEYGITKALFKSQYKIQTKCSILQFKLSEITDMLTHFEIINDYAECISECLNQLISMNGQIYLFKFYYCIC